MPWRAGGPDLAGSDVELALVKVALDDVALDESFGQRSRTVRAVVVGGVEVAVDVVDGQRQPGRVDPADFADGDILNLAQFNPRRHNLHPTAHSPRDGDPAVQYTKGRKGQTIDTV